MLSKCADTRITTPFSLRAMLRVRGSGRTTRLRVRAVTHTHMHAQLLLQYAEVCLTAKANLANRY